MEWHNEKGLRWRQLAPFGAEIDQDLAAPLSPEASARFVDLFAKHGLIVARGQSLSRDRHDALLALLGPIVPHREGEAGYIQSSGEAGAAGSELAFHADAAYTETPFEALSLHAVDVVDGASSTQFIDAQAGLELLPEALRVRLADLQAEMVPGALDRLGARTCDIPEFKSAPNRRELPAIRLNRRTGRPYIAVSAMQTAGFAGLSWDEGRALLSEIFDQLYAPDRIYEHVWHNGDVVIWDNVALQHARGNLASAGRRILQRVIVGPHAHATPYVRAA